MASATLTRSDGTPRERERSRENTAACEPGDPDHQNVVTPEKNRIVVVIQGSIYPPNHEKRVKSTCGPNLRRDMRLVPIATVATLCLCVSVQAALVPPVFINSVVALGSMQMMQEVGQAPSLQWQTSGTGFFYGYMVQNDEDVSKRRYEAYLVTAKHVVQPYISGNRDLSVMSGSTQKIRHLQAVNLRLQIVRMQGLALGFAILTQGSM
jgi:hypothetical protein